MVVKSLVEKTRHKFNASVAEVDRQESIKCSWLALPMSAMKKAMRERMLRHILELHGESTEAELISAEYEVLGVFC